MNSVVPFLFLLLLSVFAQGQQLEDAWVYLQEKKNLASYFENPLTMLSQRSLDRRERQGIPLDVKDVPLDFEVVRQVQNSPGVTVKATSKWLNALHVQGSKTAIDLLVNLSEVAHIVYANSEISSLTAKKSKKKMLKTFETRAPLDHGLATNQIAMLDGVFLHEMGWRGAGVQIAILDAGFKGVETFDAFSHLYDGPMENGAVLGGYDFVHQTSDFYNDTGSTHGLSVLSTLAASVDGLFLGTAPEAQFYLFVTEDPINETPLEESLWLEAAERSDSLGVDVINTSLGYSTFDNPNYNHAYSDMDGASTYISKGAEIAASRGIMVVVSAGNSGSSDWHYITAPADAKSVLSVGAVDASQQTAFFSSFGPTADGRIKPDITAQGVNAYVIDGTGSIAVANGTSFSAPIVSGLIACLWQANPRVKMEDLLQWIRESADQYTAPTDQGGFGIPNFKTLYDRLQFEEQHASPYGLVHTLASGLLKIRFPKDQPACEIALFEITGKECFRISISQDAPFVEVSGLAPGMYILEFPHSKKRFKFINVNLP